MTHSITLTFWVSPISPRRSWFYFVILPSAQSEGVSWFLVLVDAVHLKPILYGWKEKKWTKIITKKVRVSYIIWLMSEKDVTCSLATSCQPILNRTRRFPILCLIRIAGNKGETMKGSFTRRFFLVRLTALGRRKANQIGRTHSMIVTNRYR